MSQSIPLPDKFWSLLDSAGDGALDQTQADELATLLESNSTARDVFFDQVELWTNIRLLVRAERASDAGLTAVQASFQPATPLPSGPAFSLPYQHGTIDYLSSGWPMAYLIATVVVSIGIAIAAITHVSDPESRPLVQHSDSLPSSLSPLPSVVGQITGMADCVWEGSELMSQGSEENGQKYLESEIRRLKSPIALGDRFGISSGLLEITYYSGAKVILQGPVTYEVESAAGGYLSVGKLTARLEHKATDTGTPISESQIPNPKSPLFAVRTPTAIVTDLGTEFGVEVGSDSATVTHVFVGKVAVAVPQAKNGDQNPQILGAGQSIVVGKGKKSPVSVGNGTQFLRNMPKAVHKQTSDGYAATVLAMQPIAYYRMERPDGGDPLQVVDSASGHHNGTLSFDKIGFKNDVYIHGRFGDAICLRGPMVQDNVIVPDYPKSRNDHLSASVWIWAADRQMWSVIASNWGNPAPGQFHIALHGSDGDLSVQVTQRNGERVEVREGADHLVPLAEWVHVAFVADGTTLRLYRDGKEVASGPCRGVLPNPPMSSMSIGCKTDNAGTAPSPSGEGFWTGRIDELAVFNHTLTPKQIKVLAALPPRIPSNQ